MTEEIFGGAMLGSLIPYAVGSMILGHSTELVVASVLLGAIFGFVCSRKPSNSRQDA